MVDASDHCRGILIDLDLAVRVEDTPSGPRSAQRAVSLPFLAFDLLTSEPPPHEYRHDLESFFWCLWWIAISYNRGVHRKRMFELQGWHEGTWKHIQMIKQITQWQYNKLCLLPSPSMADLLSPLARLHVMFIAGHAAKVSGGVDESTLGGHITYETFFACLSLGL